MSQEDNTLSIGNGPMTVRRSLNNILAALNISQSKGCFTLRESAFVFSSLQKLNEFVNKYEPNEDIVPEPVAKQVAPKPVAPTPAKPVAVKQPVQKPPAPTPKKLPDINLESEEVSEIIEI